jgi:hypothetical protein
VIAATLSGLAAGNVTPITRAKSKAPANGCHSLRYTRGTSGTGLARRWRHPRKCAADLLKR